MASKKPFEVSIELTTDCNYFCDFCFGKNFPKKAKQPKTGDLKKVIEKIASEGINRIRFTGGEPLLRKDVGELLSFAKEQGLFTSLNTNASLLSRQKIKELANSLDDVLISFHSLNEKQEQFLAGKKELFDKKLNAIKLLSSEKVFVRASTILSTQNIKQLEEFKSLVESLPISQWVLLRPIPNPGNLFPVSRKEIASAVEKILKFNAGKKESERTLIENALPFCCSNPKEVEKVALGGLREDGHSTLFIDAYLSIKPSYFLDLGLGNALKDSILDAWKNPFMKRMHALEFIAEQCHKCMHVKKCMGGSRFSALLVNGSLYELDPLAAPNHSETYK